MPARRISMRKTREVLRLHFECELGIRAIARSCQMSAAKVSEIVKHAVTAPECWPLREGLSDSELQVLLFGEAKSVRMRTMPDFESLTRELKKKGVTRHLLWEEYRRETPDGYGYSQFCEHFKRFRSAMEPVMRQDHRAGEKLFVDWAGQTIGYGENGKAKRAHLFVAVLGASNYTFAQVYQDEATANWCRAHVEAFDFFGGVTEAVVPDNTKTAVTKACYYDPDLNPTYKNLAAHYHTAVLPARVRRPQDKSKVEAGVGFAETQILAALRNHRFCTFGELRQAVQTKLLKLNERPFKKLCGNRRESFIDSDQPALKPLPDSSFDLGLWQKAKVWSDYHIQVSKHFYSVPHEHIGKQVDVRLTESTIEIFHDNIRIAAHARSDEPGKSTTLAEHRPKRHSALIDRSADTYLRQGQLIGPKAWQIISDTLAYFPHPEMGFRSCQGILRLKRDYGIERLEAACSTALEKGLSGYKVINNILRNKREKQTTPSMPDVQHGNVRGSNYYR